MPRNERNFRGRWCARTAQLFAAAALAVSSLCFAPPAPAAQIARELPPGLQVPAAAQPGPEFDVEKATRAYLELLSPEQRAKSDSYFEGGYWLLLWSALWTVGSCGLLLRTGAARRMRDVAQGWTGRPWLSTAIFAAGFIVALFLLSLPFSVYRDFYREHAYRLSEQSFGGWLRDQLVGLVVIALLGSVLVTLIYAAVRRTGARWWIWATGLAFAFLMFVSLIAPPFIEPLFNDYQPLAEGPVREAVLAMARANQVPTDHVEWFDASRQTTRVSANVSGFLGTTRIALNDNLLNKTSLPEILAVLGHETGHYVLNHGWKLPILLTIAIGFMFALLHGAFDRAISGWGARLGITGRADPAGLPLALALLSVISLLFTPIENSIVRSFEAEADAFGLNAARQPHGWAMSAMRLSTYRKLEPGRMEEFVFYDHPSGYERVHGAMVWLKENQAAFAAAPGDAK